jgi:hypothetical protein
MPTTGLESAATEALPDASDSMSQGQQVSAVDLFDSDDVLNRWTVTAPAAATEVAGIPAVKWTMGAGQALTLMHEASLWNTRVPSQCLWQARIKISASAPKVMIGLMSPGASASLVVNGIWLEKAAAGTALTVKAALAAASSADYTSVSGTGTIPTTGYVEVSVNAFAFAGGMEAVIRINGMEVGRISKTGLEAGIALRPHIFVGESCEASLSQTVFRAG